jgi:undecaprenyl-diphosphatase
MSWLAALLLGLIQGLTEFIPVSSSGHLIIMHEVLGVSEGGLAFDVALHIGTLAALIVFFWNDLWQLARGLIRKTDQSRLAWLLVLATVPAVITGLLLESAAESTFRSPALVSINLIVVALIMLAAERYSATLKKKADLKHVSQSQALIMGLAQAAAVIPGVSRSGSTITAGLIAGMDRVSASRFSFLLAIPITFGAIIKVLSESSTMNAIQDDTAPFVIGILAAFVSGLFAIKFLLSFLAKHSLNIFAYYRIALAILVLGGLLLT